MNMGRILSQCRWALWPYFFILNEVSAEVGSLFIRGDVNYPFEESEVSIPKDFHRPPNESYICARGRMNALESHYIVEFRPNVSDTSPIDYMILHGCQSKEDRMESAWVCNEGGEAEATATYPICIGGHQIVYVWTKYDPRGLKLPDGVGLKIGPHSNISHVVLQVHYNSSSMESESANGDGNETDSPGIILRYTRIPQPEIAGVYSIVMAGGRTSSNSSVAHLETACRIRGNRVIHVFGFRARTGVLGQLVSVYRVRTRLKRKVRRTRYSYYRGNNRRYYDWTLIGKHVGPQLSSGTLHPVDTKDGIRIKKGDFIATRCTMKNDRTDLIPIRNSGEEEKCFVDLMYRTSKGLLKKSLCGGTAGPPTSSWKQSGLRNIPNDA